jgi:hypothetical protein
MKVTGRSSLLNLANENLDVMDPAIIKNQIDRIKEDEKSNKIMEFFKQRSVYYNRQRNRPQNQTGRIRETIDEFYGIKRQKSPFPTGQASGRSTNGQASARFRPSINQEPYDFEATRRPLILKSGSACQYISVNPSNEGNMHLQNDQNFCDSNTMDYICEVATIDNVEPAKIMDLNVKIDTGDDDDDYYDNDGGSDSSETGFDFGSDGTLSSEEKLEKQNRKSQIIVSVGPETEEIFPIGLSVSEIEVLYKSAHRRKTTTNFQKIHRRK